MSFVPCKLYFDGDPAYFTIASIMVWYEVSIRSDFNTIRTPPLELSKSLSLRMIE